MESLDTSINIESVSHLMLMQIWLVQVM